MGWMHLFGSFRRTYLVIFTFLLVVYVVISFRDWQSDFITWFFRTNNWGMLIFISLLGFAIVTILTKLLQWEVRTQTRRR
ncbi:MAG: hypothetical protein V1672_00480 [Candidatus Diapherotrites archaeon]